MVKERLTLEISEGKSDFLRSENRLDASWVSDISIQDFPRYESAMVRNRGIKLFSFRCIPRRCNALRNTYRISIGQLEFPRKGSWIHWLLGVSFSFDFHLMICYEEHFLRYSIEFMRPACRSLPPYVPDTSISASDISIGDTDICRSLINPQFK